jgi:peptide/nickel transport system permease protein
VRVIARRLAYAVAALFVIMVLTFLVFQVLGDPARRILPLNATNDEVEAFRHAHGFDRPLLVQLGDFVRGVLTADFGQSYSLHRSALPEALDAVPRTMLLAAVAFAIAACGGLLLGTVAAINHGGWIDQAVTVVGTTLASLAEFWVGLVLIIVVSVNLGLLPTSGFGVGPEVVLPAITLATPPMGRLSFVVRNSIIEITADPHLAYAHAVGLRPRTTVWRHVIRNASIPMIAVGGQELTRMLVGASVVVETVFAWPGIGRLYVTGMADYDVPLVSATLFVATALVLVLNMVLDFVYSRIDRRVSWQ